MALIYTPSFMRWQPDAASITPEVYKEPGIEPGIDGEVAPYLPLLRYDETFRQYKVVSTGKVIAKDTLGFVTMAGIRLDIEAALAAGNVTAATLAYSATDVTEGVINANGHTVTAGEKVIASMVTAAEATGGTADAAVRIGHGIGIAPYDFWRAYSNSLVPTAYAASRPAYSPTDERLTNLSFQRRVHPLCDCVAEYPVVPPENYPNSPLEGITVIEEASVAETDFLTYNVNSNLAIANISTDLFVDILFQVLRVDRLAPKAYLDRVKTRYAAGTGPNFGVLDRMPGTASGGRPSPWLESGTVFGTALVNLIGR